MVALSRNRSLSPLAQFPISQPGADAVPLIGAPIGVSAKAIIPLYGV